ncbi:hypothetical protein SAMN04489798_6196 [Pseudomonas arsenicoxydans]|uniref:Uncharacterized protein n=1 Tax=Pseudomonas arsenicoxydans TaxID=702115 RepID=A0A1H0TMI0_9PSED|nr:hypothetical protein SAMN04489798_6196 [Pseudomonas arsenicoxydans]
MYADLLWELACQRWRPASRPISSCRHLIVPYAPRGNAARDAPRSEGAGGSRSRAAGELPLGLLSGEERSVYADLLWELACQRWRPASRPVSSCRHLIVPYAPRGNAARDAPRSEGAGGSRSRAAGELPLGLLSGEERSVYADLLWELACQRWRPASRPISSCRHLIVPYAPRGNAARDALRSEGAGGSRSRAAGELPLGLLSGEERSVYADLLWELACQRWRPASRPISSCRHLIVPYAPRGNAARDALRSDGAGGSRSRAAGELQLGLLSGEGRAVHPIYCGSWPASDGGVSVSINAGCRTAIVGTPPGAGMLPQGISGLARVSAVRRYRAFGSPPVRPASLSAESPSPCADAGLPDSRRSHWP